MENIDIKVVGNKKLTITVDLSKKLGLSKSGKSQVIATTQGNVTIPGTDDVKLGLNIYKSV